MTSLVVWVGVDSRKASSIYAASDSRISWGHVKWDMGQKVFASLRQPDIFAFCGYVDFPTIILSKIVSLLDWGILYDLGDDYSTKAKKVEAIVKEAHVSFPHKEEFWLLHCLRENSGMESSFFVKQLHWSGFRWNESWLDTPDRSGLVAALGSGRISFTKWQSRWNNIHSVKGTSRSVFGAFCDGLANDKDGRSGGPPQIAGIYRTGNAKIFGVVYKEKKYLLGTALTNSTGVENVEWRNSLFERVDPITMKRLDDAQVHQHPQGLGLS